MVGFGYERLNEQRVLELRKEAARLTAARHAGASSLAKRLARALRSVAARIDGDAATTGRALPQLNQVRSLARG